jgi:hypothetical protein
MRDDLLIPTQYISLLHLHYPLHGAIFVDEHHHNYSQETQNNNIFDPAGVG